MADRPMAARIETDAPLCVACDQELLDDEVRDGFCRRCTEEIEAQEAERCPMCGCRPCGDIDGCRAEASREDRAERRWDGEE